MIYVTLPENFVAVPRYPGYYFNIEEKHLYSLKSGELKKLKKHKITNYLAFRLNLSGQEYFEVSIMGIRKSLMLDYLLKIIPEKSVVSVNNV